MFQPEAGSTSLHAGTGLFKQWPNERPECSPRVFSIRPAWRQRSLQTRRQRAWGIFSQSIMMRFRPSTFPSRLARRSPATTRSLKRPCCCFAMVARMAITASRSMIVEYRQSFDITTDRKEIVFDRGRENADIVRMDLAS